MIIYEQEKRDGISELILSKASVLLDCETKPSLHGLSKASKTESKDIFGLESILVSIGWNSNDDVFDPVETWNARSTPINKKFNYMHNEKDIIGHITSAKVLDSESNIIKDDTKIEDLPNFFEISVGSVMYSIWEDEALQERANTLMSEIAEGKWFVSMEVMFANFDYALTKGNEQIVIPRNNESSFLTKHLRVYGGAGEYDNWKIGRILKDMFFSGKGLVNNPANKRSLITSFNFNGAKASTSIFNKVEIMSVEQKDYEKAVAELGATKKELESVTQLKTSLEDQVNSLKGDLDSSKALVKDLQVKLEEAKADSNKKDEKISEVSKALKEIMEKAKISERVSMLVDAGVDKVKAEEISVKFAKASDEMFEEVVSLHKVKKVESTKEKTKELDSTQASKDELEQPAEEVKDEVEEILEKSAAYIKNFFSTKKEKGDK